MKIIIQTPEQLKSERERLIDEAMDMIQQQERSCHRYWTKLLTIRNKIAKISEKLGG